MAPKNSYRSHCLAFQPQHHTHCSRLAVLKVGYPNGQHQYYLHTCYKWKFSGLTLDTLDQTHRGGTRHLFWQPHQGFEYMLRFMKPWVKLKSQLLLNASGIGGNKQKFRYFNAAHLHSASHPSPLIIRSHLLRSETASSNKYTVMFSHIKRENFISMIKVPFYTGF